MIYQSPAIVLSQMKYAESSVIVRVYTKEKGLQSFLINGVRKKKARIRAALLQPLSLVELEAYYKPKGGLQRIKEIRLDVMCVALYMDDVKRSLAVFIAELVANCVHEDHPDPLLFDFLWNAVQWLENTEQNCANFHLVFMAQLSKFLGFMPQIPETNQYEFFDLKEGVFASGKTSDIYCINPPLLFKFTGILGSNFDNIESVKLSRKERSELLEHFMSFYKLQMDSFSGIKSLKVFTELFYEE